MNLLEPLLLAFAAGLITGVCLVLHCWNRHLRRLATEAVPHHPNPTYSSAWIERESARLHRETTLRALRSLR